MAHLSGCGDCCRVLRRSCQYQNALIDIACVTHRSASRTTAPSSGCGGCCRTRRRSCLTARCTWTCTRCRRRSRRRRRGTTPSAPRSSMQVSDVHMPRVSTLPKLVRGHSAQVDEALCASMPMAARGMAGKQDSAAAGRRSCAFGCSCSAEFHSHIRRLPGERHARQPAGHQDGRAVGRHLGRHARLGRRPPRQGAGAGAALKMYNLSHFVATRAW